MRGSVLTTSAICLILCTASGLYLYRFYNPPLSGLTDAEATQYGFYSAQNVVDLSSQDEWNTNPNKKLALMKQTFAQGNEKQKAVVYCSLAGAKNEETFRQAMALVKTQPQFWDEKPSRRATTVSLLAQFMGAGSNNKKVMQELSKDANPHVRAIAADALAYQEDLGKSDAKPRAR